MMQRSSQRGFLLFTITNKASSSGKVHLSVPHDGCDAQSTSRHTGLIDKLYLINCIWFSLVWVSHLSPIFPLLINPFLFVSVRNDAPSSISVDGTAAALESAFPLQCCFLLVVNISHVMDEAGQHPWSEQLFCPLKTNPKLRNRGAACAHIPFSPLCLYCQVVVELVTIIWNTLKLI